MSTANIDSADLKAVAKGGLIREDVMDKIWDISKIPLPLTDIIGTDSSSNAYHEWVLDALAAPDTTNARVDGADAGASVGVTGTRVGNHHQISDKPIMVSYRADASNRIGASSELARQLMRRQQELKRDVEAICLLNQASVADDGSSTAGKSGGLPSWIATAYYAGTGGGAGGFNTGTGVTAARTPATARSALTEANLKTVIQTIYQNGGDPSVIMSVPSVTKLISSYLFGATTVARIQTNIDQSAEQATAIGAVGVYVSDFGTLEIVPNRLQQTHNDGSAAVCADLFVLSPEYLAISYLKGYRSDVLAKTGLAEKRQLSVDWTLCVYNEKAHGAVYDINYGTAMTA